MKLFGQPFLWTMTCFAQESPNVMHNLLNWGNLCDLYELCFFFYIKNDVCFFDKNFQTLNFRSFYRQNDQFDSRNLYTFS